MGFRLDRSYALEFEGALAGAEVVIKGTTVATVLKIRDTDDLRELAELLAAHLIDWNFEDEKGDPVPMTVDGILTLEQPILVRICREWLKAASGITAPLESSGPEVTLGMAPL